MFRGDKLAFCCQLVTVFNWIYRILLECGKFIELLSLRHVTTYTNAVSTNCYQNVFATSHALLVPGLLTSCYNDLLTICCKVVDSVGLFRTANYCRTSDNVRLNLANVRAKVILIGHWSDQKICCHIIATFFCCDKTPIANSLNLHFAIKFTRHSSILLNVAPDWLYILVSWLIYILCMTKMCPTKFSDVGFCPTKFKFCPTKIKSDRTNVLSSQIFICSPACYKSFQQFVIVLQFNNLLKSCEWQPCSNLTK
jgi:hypothetical protein